MRLFSILSLFILSLTSQAQDKTYGFDLQAPKDWFDQTDINIEDNLNRYDLDEGDVQKIMNTHGGTIPLAIWMKYDPKVTAGMIPTIQANLRPNPFGGLNELKPAIEASVKQMKQMLTNFEMTSAIQEVTVGGLKGWHFMATFEMPVNGEGLQKVRSWSYAIPKGNYFYQINFSDMGEEDCAEIYQQVLKSIRFAKAK